MNGSSDRVPSLFDLLSRSSSRGSVVKLRRRQSIHLRYAIVKTHPIKLPPSCRWYLPICRLTVRRQSRARFSASVSATPFLLKSPARRGPNISKSVQNTPSSPCANRKARISIWFSGSPDDIAVGEFAGEIAGSRSSTTTPPPKIDLEETKSAKVFPCSSLPSFIRG